VSVFDTRSDISLVKTDSVDPAAPSGALSYTLSTTNNGPSDAQNVVVTDTLPAGISYVSGSVNAPGAACAESGGTVICNMGNLPITSAVSATIEVNAPATTGMLTNTANVSADQLDTEKENNIDSEDTAVAIGGGTGGGSSAASGEGGNSDSSDSSSSGGGGSFGPGPLIALGLTNLLRQKRLIFTLSGE